MNKYEGLARDARRRRKSERSCERKTGFDTPEGAAFACGGRAYECPVCGRWHGSTGLSRLVSRIKKRRPS